MALDFSAIALEVYNLLYFSKCLLFVAFYGVGDLIVRRTLPGISARDSGKAFRHLITQIVRSMCVLGVLAPSELAENVSDNFFSFLLSIQKKS